MCHTARDAGVGVTGARIASGRQFSVSGPAADVLWLGGGVQVTGRLPGCPEANTIPDEEGDPADGKADTVKAVAWVSAQRARTGL